MFPQLVLAGDAPPCALRGSLDPTTGIFYKAPDRVRVRTALACDKCRVRKAKCTGDRPTCERCRTRGSTCNYATDERRRKVKDKAPCAPLPDVDPIPSSSASPALNRAHLPPTPIHSSPLSPSPLGPADFASLYPFFSNELPWCEIKDGSAEDVFLDMDGAF